MAMTDPVTGCPTCDTGPFTRNHYFTGKLLVERDFTDEQRYYVEKLRHHHRALHGWGVVCGLRVKPHPNPACRDRFVCIEPGTAVDCCGREIIVPEEECVELAGLEPVRALIAEQEARAEGDEDARTHVLQLTLCYRECPVEPIPVLYDECGCDDAQCAPNRVLESYRFGAVLDPVEHPAPEPAGMTLAWTHTLAVARAHRVAYDGTGRRVYVLAANAPAGAASLLAFDAEHHALQATATFGATQEVMDLAVSADGALVFVSLRSTAAGETHPLQVHVLDADLSDVHTLNVPDDAAGALVQLDVAADGRLFAVNSVTGKVYAWPAPKTDGDAERVNVVAGPVGATALRLAPDDARLYVAAPGTASVTVVELGSSTTSTIALPAGTRPIALATAGATGSQRLVVGDESGALRVFGVHPGDTTPFPQLGAAVTLGGAPRALALSPGARWIYALVEEDAAGHARVQVVDAHRVETNAPDAAGAHVSVERVPRALALSDDGTRLYAAGAGNADAAGGVAILELSEGHCEDILRRALDGCPSCEEECLVLATITGWRPGVAIEEGAIDNWRGRRVLPSTTQITEVLRCLLERGGDGTPGEQGPPGLGIDAVSAEFVDCEEPGSAQIQTIAGVRTLVLAIPRGCDGAPGGSTGIGNVDITIVDCDAPGSAEITTIGGVATLVLRIPRGCDGAPGAGIDAVTAQFVACDQPGTAALQTIAGVRTLVLTIPRGCDGRDGVNGTNGTNGTNGANGLPGTDGRDGEGLERGLARIRALSWRHRASAQLLPILDPTTGNPMRTPAGVPLVGLVIGFTDKMRIYDAPRPLPTLFDPASRPLVDAGHVFQVLIERVEREPSPPVTCRCRLAGDVIPVDFRTDASGELIIEATAAMDGGGALAPMAPGAAWVLDQRFVSAEELSKPQGNQERGRELWVALRGDFVLDSREPARAVDAEFVRGELPTGDRPAGADVGIQGGLFESWFDLKRMG